jgi:Spy/CpxP family protein refolding chaperone
MKLKLISLTAFTALALSGVAFAQDYDSPRGHRGMRHDPMARLVEQLNLTPDQKTKVQPILDAAKPQMEQIRRDAMQKSKAVMDDTFAKIKPMLTADQQTKLEELKNNPRRHRGGGQGATDAGAGDDGG